MSKLGEGVLKVWNLTRATGDCALAPGPIMPEELWWPDLIVAVPLDGILVVYPRVLLLEQQLGQANGRPVSIGASSLSAQNLPLGSSPATSVN